MAFLDDIKSRLGFGESEEEEEFDEELYGEDFDVYADEFNSVDGSNTAEGSEQGYSSFTPISTRSSRSRRSNYEGSRSGSSNPALVSIEDVRNSTRIPESLNRDPLPPRRGENYGRNTVGHASDFALSGSEIEQTSQEVEKDERSLAAFEGHGTSTAKPASEVGIGTHKAIGGYDPYRAYEAGAASSHRPTRSVSVISPVAYGEVENVARMLRAGDAVVLSLRNTPSQLSKRILDFSFGVASALDATVDCIADKVFAITRVSSLSEDELSRLRSQGVI